MQLSITDWTTVFFVTLLQCIKRNDNLILFHSDETTYTQIKGNKRIVTSAALAKTLNDIGVNEETIQFRRTTILYCESLETINSKAWGRDDVAYHFGSQSEGTTTKGMQSDLDCLQCHTEWQVIQDLADWQFGRPHLFVVTDKFTPPQCCLLQDLFPYNPEYLTHSTFQHHYNDGQGRVFLKNTLCDIRIKSFCEKRNIDVIQHGPSRTFIKNLDFVSAFYCSKLSEDCQYIFRRPKPGNWPRPELLTQLKDSGVFLVPTAHVANTIHWDPCQHLGTLTVRKYDNSHELYWRLSTNLMERLLMFDLSMTQLKVYVVMKMIRKEFCKPLVGDRLSTFHLKTALLYSVERSPPCIWEDENLIQCLKLCLKTLWRWLKVRHCPHYTTAKVNLFAGKLRLNEFPVLIELFTDMIRTDVSCLHHVKMDDLGNRISSYSTDCTNWLPCEELDIDVVEKLFRHLIGHSCGYVFFMMLFQGEETSKVINEHARYVQNLESINTTSTGKTRSEASSILPFQYSIQASMKASLCIGQNQVPPHEIFTLYDKSLTSDVTSSRLKLASMYLSLRRFKEADAVLKQVETLISHKVMPFSPFRAYKFDLELLKRRNEFSDILQNDIALCTIFSRHEINCVCGQLVAEFHRTVTVEDAKRINLLEGGSCMGFAVVDSKTYMYYLQYLSSRLTGLISDKLRAFKNLIDHVISEKERDCHAETSFNLLGHCLELEGQSSVAWECYKLSVEIQPQNNAAYWHMFRIIYGLFMGR